LKKESVRLDKISELQGVLNYFTVISVYMKIWIFGLSWLWFFFFIFDFMLVNTFPLEKIIANLNQEFKLSYKERKWRWDLWGLLGGLESYPLGLIVFLQFSRSLKFRNRTEPLWKLNFMFWRDTLVRPSVSDVIHLETPTRRCLNSDGFTKSILSTIIKPLFSLPNMESWFLEKIQSCLLIHFTLLNLIILNKTNCF
jgi:hypothetical protein